MEEQKSLMTLVADKLPDWVDAEQSEFNRRVVALIKALEQDPDESEIEKNPHADNSKYLPIQLVEDKLTYYFMGLWQTRNFKYTVIVNEIVGDLELGVYHPVLKDWIWRSGAAAVIIQQRADWETIDGKRVKKPVDVTDISKKIANTIVKDLPHLKAECVKNAAKSFGRQFGRALNRDPQDGLTQMVDPEEVIKRFDECKTVEQMEAVWNSLEHVQRTDKRVTAVYNLKHKMLSRRKL